MARTLCVLVGRPGRVPGEVCVSAGPGRRVADLTDALAGFLGEAGPLLLAHADASAPLDPDAPVEDSGIRHGDHLELRGRADPPLQPPAVPALELRVLSGAAAGARMPLSEGRHALGRGPDCDLRIAEPSVSRDPVWILVGGGGVLVERIGERQDVRLDGQPLAVPAALPVGTPFEVGGAVLLIAPRPAGSRPPGRAGAIPFRPRNRPLPTVRRPVLALPPAPPAARGWMARGRARRYEQAARQALAALPALLAHEEAERRALACDPCDLADRARLCLPGLWERRRADPDFLRLGLGRGSQPSAVRIQLPAEGDRDLAEDTLRALLPDPPSLRAVPLAADLARHTVLAVAGEAAESAGLVRWLVVQAACLHAPGELGIAAALADEVGWEWLRWLPHAAPRGIASARRLVASGDEAEGLIAEIGAIVEERRAGAPAGRALLVLVDADRPGAERLVRQVLEAPEAGIRLVVVGPRAPAGVALVASVAGARNEVGLAGAGAAELRCLPDQVDADLAARVARDLAGIAEEGGPGIPGVGLLDGASEPLDAGLAPAWEAGAESLEAVLGMAEAGPVEVDLRAGPHAVVTGTREGGRRSLLAAWVGALALRHDPRRLRVHLLEAGGGADWDDLRELPHVEAPGAAEEALGGLVAEARRRAGLLADLGERDVRRPPADAAPPSLVVVVDGFDRLTAARPEVESLVAELAELGPGLGIHLVLGTAGAAAALPPAVRAAAALRVDLGARGPAEALLAGRGELWVADPDHVSAGPGGAVRVQRPAGAGDLAVLARAAAPAARRAAAAPPAPVAVRPRSVRRRVDLRLTVEGPAQPTRDVLVELDLDRTVAELVAALAAELELDPSAGAFLFRTGAWLRGEQTVRSAGLRVGDRVLVAPAGRPGRDAPDPDGGRLEDGRIVVDRPPAQPAPEPAAQEIALQDPPARDRGGMRDLLPVGIGIAMGLVLGGALFVLSGPGRPPAVLLLSAVLTLVMALLAAIVPLYGLARRGRAFRTASAEWRARLERLGPEIAAAQAAEAAYLYERTPDLETLVRRARTLDPALWERRPGGPDWLRLRVGLAHVPSAVAVALPQGGDPDLREEAARTVAAHRAPIEVPMVLALAEAGVAGLHGDRPAAGALARWLALQVATLHSPEEVAIAAAVPVSERPSWAWLGWLPHVHSAAVSLTGPRVVAGSAAAGELLERLLALVEERRRAPGRGEAPPAVVGFLYDGLDLPPDRVSWLLGQGPRLGVHVVWVAARRDDVPSDCGAAIGLHGAAGQVVPELHLLTSGRMQRGSTADGAPAETCTGVARALAPVRDIGARRGAAGVPERVDLLDLLRARDDLDEAVRRRWARRRGGGLVAAIGAGAGGAEAVVDLRADGPHLLVVGAGGAGKSELLRTLVASLAIGHPPSALALLLVDQEGQGTFAECAKLPHAVEALHAGGLVATLRAEAAARERALQEAAASDLAALERARPELAPPALVVVVDEPAGVPELVGDVLGVARHGGRLGIHVVMATRESKETGEVFGLRVLLRADGGEEAGTRPDLPPGRAFLRAGQEAPVELQVAFSGGGASAERDEAEILVRELEFGGTPARVPGREPAAAGVEADLSRVVGATRAAAGRLGVPRPAG
jgi:DNA segregation ATPase FtsK/SpoIIIE-like protein